MLTGQDYAVFAIVAITAFMLIRSWLAASKSGSGCGKCGGCSTKAKTETQLVQIDLGASWKR